MVFIAQENTRIKELPVRTYIAESWKKAFPGNELYSSKKLASEYQKSSLGPLVDLATREELSFFITGIWANESGSKNIDVFGYSFDKNWPGNPVIANWTIEDGGWRKNFIVECGDSTILRGEEEKYRRTTKSLQEYIENPIPIVRLVEAGCFKQDNWLVSH